MSLLPSGITYRVCVEYRLFTRNKSFNKNKLLKRFKQKFGWKDSDYWDDRQIENAIQCAINGGMIRFDENRQKYYTKDMGFNDENMQHFNVEDETCCGCVTFFARALFDGSANVNSRQHAQSFLVFLYLMEKKEIDGVIAYGLMNWMLTKVLVAEAIDISIGTLYCMHKEG